MQITRLARRFVTGQFGSGKYKLAFAFDPIARSTFRYRWPMQANLVFSLVSGKTLVTLASTGRGFHTG
jgi:hypothetical protein